MSFYDEGAADHPVSLNGHAYFRMPEYGRLRERYPNEASAIEASAIKGESYRLIPYGGDGLFAEKEDLISLLKAKELCWTNVPAATQQEFREAIQNHWERFSASAACHNKVIVLEGVFLQHPIHDLTRIYGAGANEISAHVINVANRIKGLEPILFYLYQENVREQQEWIAQIKQKPHGVPEDKIRRMELRRELEMKLIRMLPFPVHILDNTGRDWPAMNSQIQHILNSRYAPKREAAAY